MSIYPKCINPKCSNGMGRGVVRGDGTGSPIFFSVSQAPTINNLSEKKGNKLKDYNPII